MFRRHAFATVSAPLLAALLAVMFASSASGEIVGQGTRRTITNGATSVDMWFVPVADKKNAADSTGYGSVAYNYWIGEFEVSVDQWDTVANAAGITIGNGNQNWSGDQPATQVSWYAAAQFCNWLTTGDKYTGVYAFTFDDTQSPTDITDVGIDRAFRNADGIAYALPTEDEWYKAAYYDPSKQATGGYWLYPTQQDGTTGAPGATPDDTPQTTTGGTDPYTAVYRD